MPDNEKERKEKVKSAAEVSRERLRRITKTKKHSLRTARRVVKYGTKSFIRNTWLSVAAVAMMTITLIVLSATLIATRVMDTAISEVQSQVDMSIYIRQSATERQIIEIASRMRELSSVTSVEYTSPTAAYDSSIQKIIEENNITDVSYINELRSAPNKIPWTINVKLSDISDTTELELFVASDTSMKDMLDAREPSYANSNRETIDKIASVMNRIEIAGLSAAAVFGLISMLVIFNTIRMAIFNRKEEIYMMRLVGAGGGFIAGPFLIEAGLYGLISGLISGGIIYGAMIGFGDLVGSVIIPTRDLMIQYWYIAGASLLATGMVIGIISALLASNKYLKEK